VVTALSFELFSLYRACGGFSRLKTPDEYYDLPALYVDAARVIMAEESRIEEIKAKKKS